MSGYRVFLNLVYEWDCGDGREEVVRDDVVSKVDVEDNKEEF